MEAYCFAQQLKQLTYKLFRYLNRNLIDNFAVNFVSNCYCAQKKEFIFRLENKKQKLEFKQT